MSMGGLPDETRQAVQDLVALLYMDTPLRVLEQRACERAREILEAECVFLGIVQDGNIRLHATSCVGNAAPEPPALFDTVVSSRRPIFESEGTPAVGVPVLQHDTAIGALTASGGRRSRFFDVDADVLEAFARFIALARSAHASIRRRLHTLAWERNAMWLIAIAALLAILALAGYGYWNARNASESVAQNAKNIAAASKDRLDRYVAGAIQLAATAAAIAPDFRGNRSGTERFLHTTLDSSSEVVYGVGVWYEPYKFNRYQRLYGPYIHRTPHGGVRLTYQWSHIDYNYVRHAWYRAGLTARNTTRVTPPYFDIDHVYISAVHNVRANGHTIGVLTVDTTSDVVDAFLAGTSNSKTIRYLTTGDGHIAAFPGAAAFMRFVRTRHPAKIILDATDADAQAFIKQRYGADRLVTHSQATRMPVVLVISNDKAAIGSPPPPVRTLAIVAAAICLFTLLALLVMRRAVERGQALLDVERERAALSLQSDLGDVDALTGLASRGAMLRAIDSAVTDPREHPAPQMLLWIDLNGFERVNERFGRPTGDRILSELGMVLRRCCSDKGLLGRMGGDEFALLTRADVESARRLGERLHHEMAISLPVDGEMVYLDADVIVVDLAARYTSAQDVVRDAAYAMHQAKLDRRPGVIVFDPDLRESAAKQRELQAALRGAIARDEIFVEYQPIVRIRNGELVGFEALARWRREDQTVVYPTDFIPLGEQTGLVLQLDRHVAEVACDRFSQWQRSNPKLRLELNASALHFEHRASLRGLTAVVREHGLRPGSVDIELTESALMGLTREAVAAVRDLHAQGIRLHLDDFGTGYSSLSYLQRLHVDALKIDKSFVDTMLQDKRSMQIVQAIVNLAKSINVEVIAEGVTTKEQADALLKLGVTMGQGYFYAHPLTADEAERLVTHS